jgi:hypothetical protein
VSDLDFTMSTLYEKGIAQPEFPVKTLAGLRQYVSTPDPNLGTVVTVSPSEGASTNKLWGMYVVPRSVGDWLTDRTRQDHHPGLYPVYSQLCQMADSAFGTVDFGATMLNLVGVRDAADLFDCAFALWRRGLLYWHKVPGGHFWIVLDESGKPRTITDHQRETGLELTYKRRSVRGISRELCWQQYHPSGGRCALPRNHAVDHAAFSGTMTEPVDVWPAVQERPGLSQ